MYGKNIISLHALSKHSTITPVTLQTRLSSKNPQNKTVLSFFLCLISRRNIKSICKQVHVFGTNEGKSI